MPPKKKTRLLPESGQERLLQKFYDDLDNEQSDYLGNVFENENDVDLAGENISDSNSDPDEKIDMGLDDNTLNVAAAFDDPTPVRKQIFSDLENVLNLDNSYDPFPAQEYSKFEYSNASKSFQVEWETIRENNLRNSGMLPQRNVLQNKPGPRNAACSVADPLESFSLFIPDSLIETVLQFTNNRISTFHEEFPDLVKVAANRLVDFDEIKAYFGILYLRAALKQYLLNSYSIWYHESSYSIFPATMSLNRFSFITRFLQFDDRSTRVERKKYDKFACFREFFEEVSQNNARARYPSPYLAIDETLYPYRGHISFKQYNPSKPAKYGMLYRSLCDSSIQYTYFTLPYASKPEDLNNEASKFYITGTDEYSKYLVETFNRFNSIKGCDITMDILLRLH